MNNGLTRKQKAFADKLLEDPKISATQAVKETYNVSTNHSAEVIANENLSKPEIMRYLQENAITAENTLIDVMNYSNKYGKQGGHVGAAYANVAKTSADSILDRVHGKARQVLDVNSKHISITLDLTGGNAGEIPQSVLDQLSE